jgi:hypothetical protein
VTRRDESYEFDYFASPETFERQHQEAEAVAKMMRVQP